MAVRIKEGMIPYKGGVGIEITENHIINVLLREANNLIHVNDNNELYVDLQLDDGIQPDDDFPVGVTTGRILQEDGWQQSGLILNWKTTSGDYARLIYANDGNVYIDIGDGNWMLLGGPEIINKLGNCKAFFLANNSDLTTGQEALDWYLAGRYPIIVEGNQTYVLDNAYQEGDDGNIRFIDTHTIVYHQLDRGQSTVLQYRKYIFYENNEVTRIGEDSVAVSPYVLDTTVEYQTPYIPLYDGSPTTKYYVDQELLKKQDLLTPGTRITIQRDPVSGDLVISADVSGVMTYMGNVSDVSDLANIQNPSQGDCWYVENSHTMYAWDGTQWNDIGGTGIDLTNYFNMQVNTSDDITEGTTNLFVTQLEKNTWNNKQNTLIAGDNITIQNNVISARANTYTGGNKISIDQNNVINNDAPFLPENAGTMGQFLQKSNTGYKWINANFVTSVNGKTGVVNINEFLPESAGVTGQFLQKTEDGYDWITAVLNYTGGTGININNGVISNTLPFNPTNRGTTGQVIKLNADGTYSWQNDESGGGGGGGGGGNFNPDNTGQPGQVLTKKTNGKYDWEDIELPSGENNVKFWTIHSNNPSTQQMQEITDWVELDANNGAILNDLDTKDVFVFYNLTTEGLSKIATFHGTKRISERVWRPTHANGQFTKAYEQALTIDYTKSSQRYSMWVGENPDNATHTNYISALGANYEGAFIPQLPSEPATKAYVDQAVAAGPSGVGGIVSNTTGTTSRVSSIWAGTTTELNNISQRDPTCLYFSFSS